MSVKSPFRGQRGCLIRPLYFEQLENRLCLSGNPLPIADLAELGADPVLVAGLESGDNRVGVENDLAVDVGDFSLAVEAINRFAFDLYNHFQQADGNLFLSPMSISMALAMTYAGARGETASQMADVLHLGTASGIHEPGIHDSFRALLDALDPAQDSRSFDLDLANALWPQLGFPFQQEFLDLIQTQYNGGSQAVDFIDPEAREEARETINAWVEGKTHDKIQDLLPEGALDELTRLVLTNAIYFKGQWAEEFDPANTRDEPFHLESGDVATVPMMQLTSKFHYLELDGYQVLEMPYKGEDLSMIILLPAEETSPNTFVHNTLSYLSFKGNGLEEETGLNEETGLDALGGDTLAEVNDWLDNPLAKREVSVQLPKFKTTVSSSLGEVLRGMGMPLAFSDRADFSGMTANAPLKISQVVHKAFVEVNEEGTEAAAATAVVTGITCFAAGTPVLTSDGRKPIEEIRPGDYVLSRDENDLDGVVQRKLVEEHFVRHGAVLDLRLAGQSIRTTSEHPFYTQDRGWTAAGELRAGDLLATHDGVWLAVEKLVDTGQVETVYNLRVADYHTYFVGIGESALWVHNTYGGPSPVRFTADRPFHFFIRDNHTAVTLFMGRIADPLAEDNSVVPEVAAEDRPSIEVPMVPDEPHEPGMVPETPPSNSRLGDAALADLAYMLAAESQKHEDSQSRDQDDNDLALLSWLDFYGLAVP